MPLFVWLGVLVFIGLRVWEAFLVYFHAYREQHDDLDIALPGDPPTLRPMRYFLSPYVWHILRYVLRKQSDEETENKRRRALFWYCGFVAWVFLAPLFFCSVFALVSAT